MTRPQEIVLPNFHPRYMTSKLNIASFVTAQPTKQAAQ